MYKIYMCIYIYIYIYIYAYSEYMSRSIDASPSIESKHKLERLIACLEKCSHLSDPFMVPFEGVML